MAAFTVFRQRRADGGVRTGVALNGVTCAQHFVPGATDDDPALEWYVDLRGEGGGVPSTVETLLDWLPSLADVVRQGSEVAAVRAEVGVDPGVGPFQVPLPQVPPDVELVLAASAVRRMAALEIAAQIRDFGNDWEELLAEMLELAPAA